MECQPKRATAEALAAELIATGSMDSAKVLVITGNLNRDVLVKKLEEARAIVDCLQVYKTEAVDLSVRPGGRRLPQARAPTPCSSQAPPRPSPSWSRARSSGFPRMRRKPLLGSIGAQTSEAMREAGLTVDFEAQTPGIETLVQALVKALA